MHADSFGIIKRFFLAKVELKTKTRRTLRYVHEAAVAPESTNVNLPAWEKSFILEKKKTRTHIYSTKLEKYSYANAKRRFSVAKVEKVKIRIHHTNWQVGKLYVDSNFL